MAFFSSTDMNTLHEQAAQCNNVLSVVVNNDGKYVAKFTEKHQIHRKQEIITNTKDHDHWNHIGDKEWDDFRTSKYTDYKSEDIAEVHIYDAIVERPLECPINKGFKQVCLRKLKEKEEKEALKKQTLFSTNYGNTRFSPTSLNNNYHYYQDDLFGNFIAYHDDAKLKVDEMVISIINLTFDVDLCYYENVLTDNLSEDFLYHFMKAWQTFYEPTKEDLISVLSSFRKILIEEKDYPKTAAYIITYLNNLINNKNTNGN